ncbi:MAG: InlB B-repeat-containing protein, partial [Nitrososphaerota archaeon]|nr:InlB B-repeat-containing protein [Nitrososphaerota archaeon]
MSEQELFNNAGSINTNYIIEDTYHTGGISAGLGFAVSSANFPGKTLTRIKLYGGSNGIGSGEVRMWVATARLFAPNPNNGVTISARIYSTNTHEIQSVHTGSYEFTFSGVALPNDTVLVIGLEITNGGSAYDVVFIQSGVSTGSFPLYLGDVTSLPALLSAEVYNFQPACIIYGTASTVYSVTYNGNGNTGGSAPVDPNGPYLNTSTVTVLGNTGNLTKTNHTFIGWSTNSNATVAQYTAGSTFVISGNTVLYAVWSPPLTVVYDGSGNSAGSAPVDPNSPYPYGSTVTVLGHGSLWLTGYNFAGWTTDPLSQDVEFRVGDSFVITENTILYAVWLWGGPPVGNQYTVTYNGNGHTSGSPPVDYNVYQQGNTVTVLGQGTLVKSGYSFLGWATTSNAVSPNRMPGSTFGMPPNSVTLYAVWGSGGG